MKNRRGGLGRGLGALIPTGPPPAENASDSGGVGLALAVDPGSDLPETASPPVFDAVPCGAVFREIPVTAISPNPKQPRTVFDEDALEELKDSIEEVGLLQPVVVRETGPDAYELIMGERRWRASQALGREVVPAIVRQTPDDQLLRDALLENLHRANLNPLEEAAAYQQLLADFGVTQEELSRRIRRSRPQISNTIRLLNLPLAVQRRVAAGVLTAGHARALLALDDAEAQENLASRIVAEGLSVRATEELVALGEAGKAPKRPSAGQRPKMRAPGLEEFASVLSDRFDTRVKVDLGKRKGKIVIEFATVDDLERIAAAMGVQDGHSGRR